MTQKQLEQAVVHATGEPLHRIRHMGFSLVPLPPDRGPEGYQEVVRCPLCQRPVPCPGRSGDGSPTMGECIDCDLFFQADLDGVATTGSEPM